jgi:amino-acid N-acetyltransferase
MVSGQSSVVEVATVGDLPAVLALLRECRLFETGVPEAIGTFVVARDDESCETAMLSAAHTRKRLLGCAGVELYGELGLLRSVAVSAEARSSGVGSALVARAEQLAAEYGVRDLYLLTSTARLFFEKRGYVPVERAAVPAAIAASWEFREGCPLTALPMRCARFRVNYPAV